MTDISKLANAAKAKLEAAYTTLGARPGPGYDIRISPTNPISDKWTVIGTSEFGTRWLLKTYGETKFKMSNTQLARLKAHLGDWQATCYTDWTCVRTERVDP